jgi:uncharacterized membrane protein YbhN (UPF0104 family)
MSPSIPKQSPSKYRWLRWIGTAISLLLFLRLLARQDWGEVWLKLRLIPAWVLPLALGLYFIGMVANALRWYVLLQPPKIRLSFWETSKIVFMGAFISNFLPSTIGGDAARALSLLRSDADRAASLASILLDRIMNVSAFFTVLPLSVITFGSPAVLFNELTHHTGRPLWLALGALGMGSGGWRAKARRWLLRSLETFRIWLKEPAYLAGAFVVSWFSIFVIFVAIWLLALGLGIQVKLYQVMGVTGITYLLTLLPISINGFGLREIAITTLYARLGASLEQAATLAMITRFMAMTVTLPGALWVSKVASGPGQAQATQSDVQNAQDIGDKLV